MPAIIRRPNFSRRPFIKKPYDLGYRINEQIMAPELLIITEDGEKLGVISRAEALARAKEEGKDLVEIVPQGKPPVGKIISWSKLKYEQEKKKKASKAKAQEQKEIWFKSFIDDGDIQHKIKKVEQFISKKHSVKLTIRQRGRRVNIEVLKELMNKLLAATAEFATPIAEPKFNGPNYSVVINPKKH